MVLLITDSLFIRDSKLTFFVELCSFFIRLVPSFFLCVNVSLTFLFTELQRRVFEPVDPETRKVVVATNIAATSVTINGIR